MTSGCSLKNPVVEIKTLSLSRSWENEYFYRIGEDTKTQIFVSWQEPNESNFEWRCFKGVDDKKHMSFAEAKPYLQKLKGHIDYIDLFIKENLVKFFSELYIEK